MTVYEQRKDNIQKMIEVLRVVQRSNYIKTVAEFSIKLGLNPKTIRDYVQLLVEADYISVENDEIVWKNKGVLQ